ncbi:hypothetical protein Dimus_037595 [Dionaea muscipula]
MGGRRRGSSPRRSCDVGCDSRSSDVFPVLARGRLRRDHVTTGGRRRPRGNGAIVADVTHLRWSLPPPIQRSPVLRRTGSVQKAILTTSSKEVLLDSEGNRLPRSLVPNFCRHLDTKGGLGLSPIVEITGVLEVPDEDLGCLVSVQPLPSPVCSSSSLMPLKETVCGASGQAAGTALADGEQLILVGSNVVADEEEGDVLGKWILAPDALLVGPAESPPRLPWRFPVPIACS